MAGFVEKVSLTRTMLRRYDGSLVYIPNGIFSDAAQTNANPSSTFRHVVLINLHLATPLKCIRALRDELSEKLPRFAATVPRDTYQSDYTGSFQRVSASVPLMDPPRNSDSHIFSSNGTGIIFPLPSEGRDRVHENKVCSVILSDMYQIKVTMLIDDQHFTTLEAGKTEVLEDSILYLYISLTVYCR